MVSSIYYSIEVAAAAVLLAVLCGAWSGGAWFHQGGWRLLFFGCARPTTDVILGSGRRRLTVNRGRCLIRFYVYFLALCYFALQFYKKYSRANLRKLGFVFFGNCPYRGNRNEVSTFYKKAQTLHCCILTWSLFCLSTYKLFVRKFLSSLSWIELRPRPRDVSKDTHCTPAHQHIAHRFCNSSTQLE